MNLQPKVKKFLEIEEVLPARLRSPRKVKKSQQGQEVHVGSIISSKVKKLEQRPRSFVQVKKSYEDPEGQEGSSRSISPIDVHKSKQGEEVPERSRSSIKVKKCH